jgi:hypothetical protein
MSFTVREFNYLLFFKLPSAFFCGVRLKKLTVSECTVSVRHKWINQNPFHSMYFAVQAMAAEMSTGVLVMLHLRKNKIKASMLVTQNKANFTKKATGRITFVCKDGLAMKAAIQKTIASGEDQSFWMKSVGTNKNGIQVSEMDFEWSIRIK